MKKLSILLTLVFVIAFTFVACGTETSNDDTTPDSEDNIVSTEMVILQAYGVGEYSESGSVPALSHSFVELYNKTTNDIVLDGYSLQYACEGDEWEKINLVGTVPAGSSFLVRANEYGSFSVDSIDDYDMQWNVTIQNKGAKFCLVSNTDIITVANPYGENGASIDGYVDMLAMSGTGESIDGGEKTFLEGQSKQKAGRRLSLTDTNDNSIDFCVVDYSSIDSSLTYVFLPKSTSYGEYNPFEHAIYSSSFAELMIYEVYGTGGKSDTPVNRSFVKLYNSSDSAITLDGYTLAYSVDGENYEFLELSGSIGKNEEFLIVGKVDTTDEDILTTVFEDEDADMVCDWQINNKTVTIALINSTNVTDANISENISSNLVDLIGISSVPFEQMPLTGLSKQKSARRVSYTDTNNNALDFEIVDYR